MGKDGAQYTAQSAVPLDAAGCGLAYTVLQDGLTAREILRKFRVRLVCTTADPIDDLSAHGAIVKANAAVGDRFESFRVLPTFRPDKALRIDMPQTFLPWLQKLREASNVDLPDLTTFLDALRNRHDYFDEHGCRSSDHGLARCYAEICDEATAAKIYDKGLSGQSITPDELESYGSFLLFFLACSMPRKAGSSSFIWAHNEISARSPLRN